MSFLTKDEKLLEKYNEIQENICNIIKKEFGSNPKYNEKYIKTKIKSYGKKININFYSNKVPKEGDKCICLSVILLGSVCRREINYYPQMFSEECKYVVKENKKSIKKCITDDIEISSSGSDKENSDKENSDKEN